MISPFTESDVKMRVENQRAHIEEEVQNELTALNSGELKRIKHEYKVTPIVNRITKRIQHLLGTRTANNSRRNALTVVLEHELPKRVQAKMNTLYTTYSKQLPKGKSRRRRLPGRRKSLRRR